MCGGIGVDVDIDVGEGVGTGVAVATDSSPSPQANPHTNIIPMSTTTAILATIIYLCTGVMRILQGDSPVNMHGIIGGDSYGGFAVTVAVENVTVASSLIPVMGKLNNMRT
jgi:hypothetical protein